MLLAVRPSCRSTVGVTPALWVSGAPPVWASASVIRRRAPPAEAVEPPAEETLATASFILRALRATGPLSDEGGGDAAPGVWPVAGAVPLPVGSVVVPGLPTPRPMRRTREELRRLGSLRRATALERECEWVTGISATLFAPVAARGWPIFTRESNEGRTGASLRRPTLSESSARRM